MKNYSKDKKKIKDCFEEIKKSVLNIFLYQEKIFLTKKAYGELVTNKDIEINNIIISVIKKYFPTHSIHSEESGKDYSENKNKIWIVDPIDNTVAFLSGDNVFTISIDFRINNKSIISMIINPTTKEIYEANENGAYKNNRIITTYKASFANKERGISTCTYVNPMNIERVTNFLKKIFLAKFPIRISGGAASDLCKVAEGIYCAHVSYGAHIWDVSAGLNIVKHAGGVVKIFDKYPERESFAFIAAGNKKIMKEILTIL